MNARNSRQRRARYLWSALAPTIVLVWGGAAAALPQNGVTAGFSGVVAPTIGPPVGPTLTVNTHDSLRTVINWSSFNIASGETVTFTQPGTSSIAFNVVPSGVLTTISGNLNSNGGVWVMSPGGVIFGAGAVVSTGSFLASTGNFTATSQTEALASTTPGSMIEIFAQSTPGVGSISVAPTASITANAGFVALQAPTIDQEGTITATDAVVLNAMEGMQVTINPTGGVLLDGEVPTAPNGGSSNITEAGPITAGWVELDAFNNNTANPGVSGIINLTGHIDATGLKPGGNDSVDLTANFGSADPSALVTTLNAGSSQITSVGNINASAGTTSAGTWTTTTDSGLISVNAGPGGIKAGEPLTTQGFGDIDLTATGPLAVTAPITSDASVNLNADTVSLGAGAAVTSNFSTTINTPDGFAADPTSSITAGDNASNYQGVVIDVGSTGGPANLVAGQISASFIDLQTTGAFTRPAGGVSSGPGDITLGGAVNALTTNPVNNQPNLTINAFHSVVINAPVTAQGVAEVFLNTNQGGSNGDYSFGTNGSLSFTGTPNTGQSLNINGNNYTLLYSPSDMLNVSNNQSNAYYALANDIDFANLPNPTPGGPPQAVFFTASPMGNTSEPGQDGGGAFDGIFTGLGHTLSNLNVNQTIGGTGAVSNGEVGLFGLVGYGGVVRDFTLVNPQVTGADGMDVGAVAGYIDGTVQNVTVSGGQITGGLGFAFNGFGGLVGVVDNGALVVNSHTSANVTGGQGGWVGGLAGVLTGGGAIQQAYATGAVTTGDGGVAGGLVGATYDPFFLGAPTNSISGSYATGAVTTGMNALAGGFIGEAVSTTITTSHATGSVTQTAISGSGINEAGGFAGYVGDDATITQSYASGAVNSPGSAGNPNAVGGFVGLLQDNGAISDSYALGAVTSSTDSFVGGFAGILSANSGGQGLPSIQRVYATGAVTDTGVTGQSGGLVGELSLLAASVPQGSISNSFWDSGTTGASGAIGLNAVGPQTNLTAVTGATAYLSATYATTFDLTNTWVVFNGETRPLLRSEYATTIANAHQLQLMSLALGATYTLADDIDASETSSAAGVWNQANKFVPVGGTAAAAFTGSFDGQGHTISNLAVLGSPGTAQSWGAQSTLGAAGLFGFEGAAGAVSNVNLTNVNVQGGVAMDVGGLIGVAQGAVSNSSTSGLVETGSANGTTPAAAGGLVGGAGGTITGSSSSATVNGTSAYVGGLVGWLAPGGAVASSSASGAVTSGDGLGGSFNSSAAGGLVGFAGTPFAAGATATISQSNASGAVTAGGDAEAGGLIGEIDGANVNASFAKGNVDPANSGVASAAGGFVGDVVNGQITASYATGTVSVTAASSGGSGDAAGGFAGIIDTGGVVTNSYSTGAVSGQTATTATLTTEAGGFVGQINLGGSAVSDYAQSNVTISGAAGFANAGGFAGNVNGSASFMLVSGALVVSSGTSGGLVGTLGATGVLTTGFWDAGVSPGPAGAVGATIAGGATSGVLGSVGGVGPSPYLAASYTGFDFANTWYLIPGETRPILRGQYSTSITNAYQLELMSLDLTASYTLANDVNASETTSTKGVWNPANGFVPVGGLVGTPFSGSFNGAGHAISNLTVIAAPGSSQTLADGNPTLGAAGLFGFAGCAITACTTTIASISNVTLTNASVTAGNGMAAGALVGNLLAGSVTSATSSGTVVVGNDINSGGSIAEATAGGLVGASSGALDQTSSSAIVSSPIAGGGEAQVGGLVGQLQGGSILDSHATGQVSVGNYGGVELTFGAGGLVGVAEGTAPSITGSYATGAVSGGNGASIGGFIGISSGIGSGIGQIAAIATSYATGAVTETGSSASVITDNVGGFAGALSNSQVSQSFASGPVSSNVSNNEFTQVGGFVGSMASGTIANAYASGSVTASNAPTSQDVGGFAGFQSGGTIQLVLATGLVSPTTGNVGGLIGFENGGALTNSYWDSGATNQPGAFGTDTFGGVTGATDVAFNAFDPASYPLLDFATPIWSVPSTGPNEYPQLYGVSHVLRLTAEDTTTVYADYPVYTVDEFGFQPLEGASLVTGVSGGATNLNFSGSGHYVVTAGTPYPIVFAGASATSPDGSGAYRFIYANGNLAVTPRTLVASLTNVDKTYDSTTNANLTPGNFQLFGTIGGDDVSINAPPNSGVYATPNVGFNIGVTVNGAITLTGADAANYTVNNSIVSQPIGEIDPAPLELSAVPDFKVYDGGVSSSGTPFVVGGLFGSDSVTGLSQVFDSKNAGARTLLINGFTVNDGNGGNNYTVTLDSAAGTITPAPLTLAAVPDARVYNGTTGSVGTPTETGLVGGDSLSSFFQTFDSKNAGARTLGVDPSVVINDGNNGGNYDVTFTTAAGSITPAPLTLAAIVDIKTYDGTTNSSATPLTPGLFAGDTVTSLFEAYDSRNAGARTLSIVAGFVVNDGNGGNNYTVSTTTAAGQINQAPLTLAAVPDTRVYNGTAGSAGTPTETGLVGGDSLSNFFQLFDSKNAGARTLSVGAGYLINDGNGGNNYSVTLTTAAGSITPAPLTLAAIADIKTYDGTTNSSATPLTPGLFAGDSVTGLIEVFNSRNAGARILSVGAGFVVNDGNGGNNYTITTTTAAGTITQAALDIDAVGDTKVYDATSNSALTPTTAGLVAGDSVSGLFQSFDSKNAGSRTLTVGAGFVVNDGNGGNNYSVTLIDADGTITPAPLTLAAIVDIKVYDGTTNSSATPLTPGLFAGDTVTSLFEAYDSRNAGARTLSIVAGFVVNDGNGGNNYTVSTTTAAGQINQAPLTLAAVPDTRVYNGTAGSVGTPTETGLVGGDSLSNFFQLFDSKNAGARTLSVGAGYLINDGNGGNNYSVTLTTAAGSITPAPLTLAAIADIKTYDGTTNSSATPLTPGLFAGDSVTGLIEVFNSRNAGARILSVGAGFVVNDGNGGNNYTITTTTAAGTITQAALDIDAVGDTKVYDATSNSALTPTTAGLVAGDSVSGLFQSFDSKNAGSRTLTVGAGFVVNDGNGGNNYSVTLIDADGTITPAPLTLSAIGDIKVYDGGTSSSGAPFVVGGLQGNDSVSGLSQAFDSKNAGARLLLINGFTVNDGNGGANYTVTLDSAAGTITPAPLTLDAVPDARVYNGTTSSAGTPTETGLVGGDTLSNFFQLFNSKNAGARTLSVGAGYLINDGNGGNNYSVTLTTAAGSITPAPLTLAAIADIKTYDGTTSDGATPTIAGLFAGDSVTGLIEVFNSRNAGARILSVGAGFVVNDGNGGNNYTITTTTAAGTITQAALDIDAVGDTKVYDATSNSALTPTTAGLVAGDSVSGLFQSFDSKNAGARILTVGAGFVVNDGNGGNNYSVTLIDADGTITPAPLTLSAIGDLKVYDGGTSSSGAPFVVGGLQGNDSVSGLSQAFDSKNAGARLLLINGFTVNDGNGGANYTVTLDSAAGTITPAPLTLDAVPDARVYNGTTSSAGAPTETGLVGGDSLSNFFQLFNSKNAGARTLSVGAGYLINDGNGGNNYSVTLTTAAGSITPAPLTLAAIADIKTYDGTTNSSATPLTPGLFAGDSVTGLIEVFNSRNAGVRILSVGAGFVVNDANGGNNYTITTTTAAGQINPAALDISAVADTKVYDSTTTAGATPTTTGLVAGDSVSGLFERFDSKNAGARTLLVNPGFVINDGNGGANYTVSTTLTAAGTITPAPLTLDAVPDSKVYNASTSSSGTPFVVGGLFGSDSVSGLSQAFDSKNAGARTLLVDGFTVNDGNGGANYTVTLDSASGTITPAPLIIGAVPDSKVYDGTISSAGTPTVVGGLFGNDSVSGLSQVFDSKDAGARTLLINPAFTVNDGNNGNNYTVTFDPASGTITPRPINVDLIGDVFKVYDGNTNATLTASNYALTGILPGDTVSFRPVLAGSYDTPFQGTGKTVTVMGLVLTGTDAGDYTLPPSSSGPIGTICLAGCILPPVFSRLIDVPIFPLQFGFLTTFPLDGDFPVAPDDDSSPKGDLFPVTGAGNRDLWTWSPPSGDSDKDKKP